VAVAFVLLAMVVATGPAADAVAPGDRGAIAFVSDRDGNDEIYLMGPDGANPVNLTRHPSADRSPAWSPDGRRIAFVSDRDGNDEIYLMDADGSNRVNLTRHPAHDSDPTWSPDGRWIAFASHLVARTDEGAEVTVVPSGIFVMEPTGTRRSRLTRADDGPPAYAPPPEWEIGAARDGHPAWSQDGLWIAFTRTFEGPTPSATVSMLSRSVVTSFDPLAIGDPAYFGSAGWEPGGTDFFAPEPWWSGFGSLAVAGIDHNNVGARVTMIRNDGADRSILPNPGGATHMVDPAVAPDGTSLAAVVYDLNQEPADIMLMGLDGADPINLTDAASWDDEPAWQPLNPIPAGLVDTAIGRWYLRDTSGLVTTFEFGGAGDAPFMGDWDCDGIDTPGAYREADATVHLRNTNTTGGADRWFGVDPAGGTVLAGDWDGDGCDTIAVFRDGYLSLSDALPAPGAGFSPDRSYWFGIPADRPFSGDFNGNGRDTIGVHRIVHPILGTPISVVYLNFEAPAGPVARTDAEFWYGAPDDVVFAGRWAGTGPDTVAAYRSVHPWYDRVPGRFFFRFSNTTGIADREFFDFFADLRGFEAELTVVRGVF
jgi:hypothetical protein